MASRRVVVTGLGLVTPLGIGVPFNWHQITNGVSGIKQLTDVGYEQIPSRVAGVVPRGDSENELNLQNSFSSVELRSITSATAYAMIAAEEALHDANWKPSDLRSLERTGCVIGQGLVDLYDILAAGKAFDKSYSRISPFFLPRILNNMPSGHISIKYGFQGPNHSVSTACATGCHAIGDSYRLIKHGYADVMVCGGTEASVTPLAVAAFCRLRALSTKFNNTPELASRPFDTDRDGFVISEGSGILILEEREHAMRRRATIYGEVLGYGMSGDAYHITAPRNDGSGAVLAMKRALEEAGLDVSKVGYINAHATSTALGDDIEVEAIKSLFRAHSKNLSVSSTKGAIGHLLGAAGAVETIFTILACHSAYIPPTMNLRESDPGMDLDLVPNRAKAWIQNEFLRIALSNSFGFGGTNASICVASSCDTL